ncbi:MAG: heavy metal translocating P-type ATPase [Clostridia bacterium]|nr:heavy metal translocating P-type ATPase [Clostridia bacterium]
MTKFDVGGMTCAACSARVEKAVSSLDGVKQCSVNLLTNSMIVDSSISNEEIISAVEKAGYSASVSGEKKMHNRGNGKNDAKHIFHRLLWSLVFLAALMYVSMGHTMWGWYLPEFLKNNPVSQGILQLILSSIILVINQRFFISGIKAVKNRTPNMDTLVSLGSGASFIYSIYALFAMSHAVNNANYDHAFHYLHELYFESAAMILALITLGKMLEEYSKGKTTSALNELINLAPKKASLVDGDKETIVDASALKPGDIIAVRPGESFAADGVIIDGESSVDESALTGESIPVDKKTGDIVNTATVNKSGFLKCRVTKSGEDTILAGIIKMVSDASASKAPIAKIADKVSGIFVPSVIAIALVTIAIWLLIGKDIGFSLARGISVLVISCPCALGLATPVAIMVSSGIGAKNGILFKNATALENLGRVNTVVFDKTGTITKGTPEVTDLICISASDEEELLKIASSIEAGSEHPLSRAIIGEAQKRDITPCEISDFVSLAGNGIKASYNGETVYGGKLAFIKENCRFADESIQTINDKLSQKGKTPMYFATKSKILGVIAVADTIKEESVSAVEKLHKMGIKTVMLTGDNELTAKEIASKVGIDTVIAGVLPGEKAQNIKALKRNGAVAMVGDGINDAPALANADIGIAVSRGTDIAIDAAEVVLMKDSLSDVPAAIVLSRLCLRNIKENLFWAFIYNTIGIPLAAGVFISLFGWQLTPMFGAAAMSLSSFCVVSNALRLNLADIYKTIIKKPNKTKKEKKTMEKIIKIEGMMCPHCEARVKQLLEEIDGVESAVTSHKEGTAVVTLSKDVEDSIFEKVITDAGYSIVS